MEPKQKRCGSQSARIAGTGEHQPDASTRAPGQQGRVIDRHRAGWQKPSAGKASTPRATSARNAWATSAESATTTPGFRFSYTHAWQRLEFREELLDRVEVGALRRQIEQGCAARFYSLADGAVPFSPSIDVFMSADCYYGSRHSRPILSADWIRLCRQGLTWKIRPG